MLHWVGQFPCSQTAEEVSVSALELVAYILDLVFFAGHENATCPGFPQYMHSPFFLRLSFSAVDKGWRTEEISMGVGEACACDGGDATGADGWA